MTPKFAQQLFMYRNLLVAIGNGSVTWIILIIAPLGLFAVMMNTALVFSSSLIFGVTADKLLKNLLKSADIDLIQARSEQGKLSEQQYPSLPKD